MGIIVESYVTIDHSSPITSELNELDRDVEVVIGSSMGTSSALRLLIADVEACRKLGRELIDASDRLESALSAEP